MKNTLLKILPAFLLILTALTISVPASARPTISIYYSYAVNPFGVKVLENGHPVCCLAPAAILSYAKSPRIAYKKMRYITDFFEQQFGQVSYDGKNSPVKVVVNVAHFSIYPPLWSMRKNAAWIGHGFNLMAIGAGGKNVGSFVNETDILAHEYTHAMAGATADLNNVGQSGALNESFADIFGEMAKQYEPGFNGKKWIFGANVLSPELKRIASKQKGRKAKVEGLRDLLHPANSLTPQPEHMDKIPKELSHLCVPSSDNDYCGVHVLDGIPNRAMALMVRALGWEKMKNILWTVMTYKLERNAQFSDFAREMLGTCEVQLSADDCQMMAASLYEVGL